MGNLNFAGSGLFQFKVWTMEHIHVFTDNLDELFVYIKNGEEVKTYNECIDLAKNKIEEWRKLGYSNFRIYSVHEYQDAITSDIENMQEILIYEEGNYPR